MKKQLLRTGATVLLLFTLISANYYFFIVAGFIFLLLFWNYYEFIILALAGDNIYGVYNFSSHNFLDLILTGFILTIISVTLLFIVFLIKKRLVWYEG